MVLTDIIKAHNNYGTTLEILKENSIFKECFENIVLTPLWDIDVLDIPSEYITKVNRLLYNVESPWYKFSYIKVGMIGATNLMDIALELSLFNPKNIIFVGSAGSLLHDIKIGDTAKIEKSICGDGSSRYLNDNLEDEFGKYVMPSTKLNEKVMNCLDKNGIKYHRVINFCVDSIFAQFNHIDFFIGCGAQTLEMETYSVFKVCEMCKIPVSAIINISDSTVANKSLYFGRTEEENIFRKKQRNVVLTKTILDLYRKKDIDKKEISDTISL